MSHDGQIQTAAVYGRTISGVHQDVLFLRRSTPLAAWP